MDADRRLHRRFPAVLAVSVVVVVVAAASAAPSPAIRAELSPSPASIAVDVTRHRLGRIAARVAIDGADKPRAPSVSSETTSERAVVAPSAATQAAVTTAADGVRENTTDGYRCFKIKYTTPTPVTKRWSPKIKKCVTSPETNNAKKAPKSTTKNDDVSATATATADDADKRTETSVFTTEATAAKTTGTTAVKTTGTTATKTTAVKTTGTTAVKTTGTTATKTTAAPANASTESTTACMTATICLMEITTTKPTETDTAAATAAAADNCTTPTDDNCTTAVVTTDGAEDPSCTDTEDKPADTAVGSGAVASVVGDDNESETTKRVQSKGGKKTRKVQRAQRRRASKSPDFHGFSASRRTADSACERLIPSKCGTDSMAGLRKSIIAEFLL